MYRFDKWLKSMLGGKSPQEVFYEECKRRGVDPSEYITMAMKMMGKE